MQRYVECAIEGTTGRKVVGLGNNEEQAKGQAQALWTKHHADASQMSVSYEEYVRKSDFEPMEPAPPREETATKPEWPLLLTVGEAAQILQVSSETIRNYLKTGTLTGQKVGKQHVLFKDNVTSLQAKNQPRALPGEGTGGKSAQELADEEAS